MRIEELFKQAEKLREAEDLDAATEIYKKVAILAKKERKGWFEAESIHMLGVVFNQLKNLADALDYLDQAERLFFEQKNLGMVGAVLRDKGMIAINEKNFDKAEQLLKKSIQYLENEKLGGHLGISKVKLGELYLILNKLSDAERFVLEGIDEIKNTDDQFFESSAYFALAKIQRGQKQNSESQLSARRALNILEKVSFTGHKNRKDEIQKFIKSLV